MEQVSLVHLIDYEFPLQSSLEHLVAYTIFSLIWFVIFFARKDLRRKLIKVSLAGFCISAPIAYLHDMDYYTPPFIFGVGIVSFEDVLFGLLAGGIMVSIYDVIFSRKNEKTEPRRAKFFIALMAVSFLSIPVLTLGFGMNSVFVSFTAALISSVIMIYIRRDLLIPSVFTGLLMLAITIPVYSLLFNVIATDYWDKYWLLANTKYGVKVLGNIPVTELLWYFCWGCSLGIGYEFATGQTKSDYKAKNITKQPTDS